MKTLIPRQKFVFISFLLFVGLNPAIIIVSIYLGIESKISVRQMEVVIDVSERLSFLLCIISFAMWKYRAFKNTEALHPNTSVSATTAILYYFVPIGTYFLPYKPMKEIVDVIHKHGNEENEPPRFPYPLLTWWWVTFTAGRVLIVMATRILKVESVMLGTLGLGYLCLIGSGILVILMTKKITGLHEEMRLNRTPGISTDLAYIQDQVNNQT